MSLGVCYTLAQLVLLLLIGSCLAVFCYFDVHKLLRLICRVDHYTDHSSMKKYVLSLSLSPLLVWLFCRAELDQINMVSELFFLKFIIPDHLLIFYRLNSVFNNFFSSTILTEISLHLFEFVSICSHYLGADLEFTYQICEIH